MPEPTLTMHGSYLNKAGRRATATALLHKLAEMKHSTLDFYHGRRILVNYSNGIAQAVRAFIVSNFLYGRCSPFTNQASLTGDGIVDSTGVLELVDFLQQTYNITVEDDERRLENLDTIDNITTFLSRKLARAVSPELTRYSKMR